MSANVSMPSHGTPPHRRLHRAASLIVHACCATVPAALLVGAATHARAATFSLCSKNSIGTSTRTATGNDQFNIDQCTVSGLVTLSATGMPASGAGVTALFTTNTIAADGCLMVEGPTDANAPNKAPLFITVSGNTFGKAALFRFKGSLPPSSLLIVEGNSFVIAAYNSFTGINPSWCGCSVSIADDTATNVNANSRLVISNNTFTGTGEKNLVASVCFTAMNLLADTSVNITSNNAVVKGNSQTHAFCAFLEPSNRASAPLTFAGNNAKFIFDKNNLDMETTTGSARPLFFFYNVDLAAGVSGTQMIVSNTNAVFRGGSTFPVFGFQFRSPFSVNYFSFKNNTVTSPYPSIVYFGTPTIPVGGLFEFIGNSLHTASTSFAYLFSLVTVIVKTGGRIKFEGNYVEAAVTGQKLLAFTSSFTADEALPTTIIKHCGNSFSWSPSPTVAELFSSDIQNRVEQYSTCLPPQSSLTNVITSSLTAALTTTAAIPLTPSTSATAAVAATNSAQLTLTKVLPLTPSTAATHTVTLTQSAPNTPTAALPPTASVEATISGPAPSKSSTHAVSLSAALTATVALIPTVSTAATHTTTLTHSALNTPTASLPSTASVDATASGRGPTATHTTAHTPSLGATASGAAPTRTTTLPTTASTALTLSGRGPTATHSLPPTHTAPHTLSFGATPSVALSASGTLARTGSLGATATPPHAATVSLQATPTAEGPHTASGAHSRSGDGPSATATAAVSGPTASHTLTDKGRRHPFMSGSGGLGGCALGIVAMLATFTFVVMF